MVCRIAPDRCRYTTWHATARHAKKTNEQERDKKPHVHLSRITTSEHVCPAWAEPPGNAVRIRRLGPCSSKQEAMSSLATAQTQRQPYICTSVHTEYGVLVVCMYSVCMYLLCSRVGQKGSGRHQVQPRSLNLALGGQGRPMEIECLDSRPDQHALCWESSGPWLWPETGCSQVQHGNRSFEELLSCLVGSSCLSIRDTQPNRWCR